MAKHPCSSTDNSYSRCGAAATFGVWWIQSATDIRYCCAHHLSRTVRTLSNEHDDYVKVSLLK
jgi:hypothetical protein